MNTEALRGALLVRVLIRVAVLLAIAAAVVVGLGSPATAICEGDIRPVPPRTGFVGTLVGPPRVLAEGDPLAGDDVAWLDTYGPSTKWNTYDLGCGPDLINHPTSIPFTSQSNLAMGGAVLPVVMADVMGDWVLADPFDWLAPVAVSIQGKIGAPDGAFAALMPLSIICLGAWVIWRAKDALLHETASTAAAALLILGMCVWLLQYPQRANDVFQSGIDTGVELAQSTFADDDFADVMFQEVIYRNWLAGELGDPESTVADKYGPGLYRSQHTTYAEIEAASDADGGTPDAELAKAKADDFADLADKVENSDPAAYAVLTGQDGSESRLGLAAQTAIFTWTASAFYALAMFMLGLAKFMIWVFIIGFPLVAVMGIHPKWRPKLLAVVNLVTASLIAGFKFLLAAGLYSSVAQGILQAPGMSGVVKFLLLVVVSIAGVMILRPIKTMKTFVPGADPNQSYVAGGIKRALDYALDRSAHAPASPGSGAEDQPKTEPVVVHAEEDPLPSLEPSRHVTPASETGSAPETSWRGEPDREQVSSRRSAIPSDGFEVTASVRDGRPMASPTDAGWDAGHEYDDFARAPEPVVAESVVDQDGNDVFVLYQTSHSR